MSTSEHRPSKILRRASQMKDAFGFFYSINKHVQRSWIFHVTNTVTNIIILSKKYMIFHLNIYQNPYNDREKVNVVIECAGSCEETDAPTSLGPKVPGTRDSVTELGLALGFMTTIAPLVPFPTLKQPVIKSTAPDGAGPPLTCGFM